MEKLSLAQSILWFKAQKFSELLKKSQVVALDIPKAFNKVSYTVPLHLQLMVFHPNFVAVDGRLVAIDG